MPAAVPFGCKPDMQGYGHVVCGPACAGQALVHVLALAMLKTTVRPVLHSQTKQCTAERSHGTLRCMNVRPSVRVCMQGAASLQLRTSLLVQGSSGSGKAWSVEAATRALGIHLVPYTCSSLQVGSQMLP